MKNYDSYLSDSDRTSRFNGLFSKLTKKEETRNPPHKELNDDSEEKGLITSYADRLKDGFFSSLTKTRSVLAQSQDHMNASINFAKNLPYIILLLVAGSFFLMIALFYLPTILIWPSKFSFSFAIASVCFLSAIALVRDPNTFMKSLIRPEKIKYSAAYAISLIGTFYFSMVSKNFLLSLIFAIAQIVSLMWLIGSSVPGGLTVVGTLQNFCLNTCKSCFGKLLGNGNSKRQNPFLPI